MNDIKNENKPKLMNIYDVIRLSHEIKIKQIEFEQVQNNTTLDKFTRKMKMQDLNLEINNLHKELQIGILIENDELKNKVINDIINYLESYGYKREFISCSLADIKFLITDEKMSSGGLLSYVCKKIYIDYSLADFDENGIFIGFKEDKKIFLRYVLTHEFLHACSISNQKKSFIDDAFSEGLTDMFAHIISKNFVDKNNIYDFSVKVCTLFTNMVGIEKILSDYINNLGELPNLQQFFYDQGLNKKDYLDFYNLMNQILELHLNKKDRAEQNLKKKEIIEILKTNLFIPFLKNNKVDNEEYINLFNKLFEEFGINCSLCEINKRVK